MLQQLKEEAKKKEEEKQDGSRLKRPVSEINQGIKSQTIAAVWRQLPIDEKDHWTELASFEKAAHKAKYPTYRYRPGPSVQKLRRRSRKPAAEQLEEADTVKTALDKVPKEKPKIVVKSEDDMATDAQLDSASTQQDTPSLQADASAPTFRAVSWYPESLSLPELSRHLHESYPVSDRKPP